MTSDIRITAEDLFHQAADLALPDRRAFLDHACADNAQLRREVEELLSFDQASETFLEKPALDDAARELAAQLARVKTENENASEDGDTVDEPEWSLGPYRILHQLGRGGMGIVYLGLDTRDERRVAIKVLPKGSDEDADRLARFTREGRMLSELKVLRHPNIAEIYEQAEYDDQPCIVLEYVPGETLADRLRKGALPIGDTLQYALQIADALKAAHDHRIVHRDLKPANVKITPEGKIKILDFGIAKRFYDEIQPEHQTRSVSLTESGMLLGTPAYMSPEQWNGQAVDQRTDLWAFGCLLYEMLTGEAPFAGKNRAQTMKAILSGNANWSRLPKATPLAIQNLIQQCFEKNPSARLADAGEARRMIAEALSQNRFALSLFLKSQYWRLSPRTKGFLAWSLIVLALVFTWQMTPAPRWAAAFFGGTFITDQDDVAILLQQKMGQGINLDLIRAALMPHQQSSIDLLAMDESLRQNQNYAQAIDEIITELREWIAKEKSPQKQAPIYTLLAQAHLFQFYLKSKPEDKDAAVSACQNARKLLSESFEAQLALGRLFNAIDSPIEAIAILEKARLNPRHKDDVRLLSDLAIAYDLNADDEHAVPLFETAIRVCNEQTPGKCASYHNELGGHYFMVGNYEKARDHWQKVTEQDVLNPFGYSNLGMALLYQGCVDQAIVTMTKSLGIRETAFGFSNRGMAYFFQGKFAEAIRDWEVITLKEAPLAGNRPADFWGALGDGYRISGQAQNAIDAYRKAIELTESHLKLSPDDPGPLAYKAEWIAKLQSLGVRDSHQNPEEIIEKVLQASPACTECLGAAVVTYFFTGNRARAIEAASNAVKGGYSPFILVNNPELNELRQERVFQSILRSGKPKC
jgi:serine/threonine protein kinase/Flp pilus assembly protein TadD